MATYTPNYNLGKPEATDPFGNFRQLFNDNMDEIDANLGGGGGSGGHTIYDKYGNALAQESGLQFTGAVNVTDDNVNGRTVVNVSGGNNLILDAKIYSDNEKVVGVWRDNKPLYQKTIYTNNATVNNEVAISVSSLNVDSLVDIKGTYDRIVNWLSPPLHMIYCFDVFEGNDEQSFIRYDVDDKNIKYRIKLANNEATSYQAITIQYTKTTDVAGSGGYEAYGFSPVIYSDIERVIGVWRDNKPLYQRTIYIPSLPNATEVSYPHNISDLDRVVEIFGIAYNSSGYSIPIIFANPTYVSQVTAYTSATDIYIGTGMDRTSFVGYITLRYTKTTDVAGSGDYNTYGVPTVHYDTNEQVIGTWIDGKPLYERTLSLGALPNNSIKTVPHNIANVDLIFVSDSFFQTGAGASSYLNYTNDTTAGQTEILVGKTNIEIWAGSNRTSWNGYVTVRYTKTTD